MTPITILITGLSITGNKGAALLLEGLTTEIKKELQTKGKTPTFIMTTPLPDADRAVKDAFGISEVHGPHEYSLKRLAYYLLFRIGIKKPGEQGSTLFQAAKRADVVVDCSGISFTDSATDGRTRIKTHIFDALKIAIPVAYGKKVIKFTQTIGPITHLSSRVIAKWGLKKASIIIPRDEASHSTLKHMRLKNIVEAHPDIAFSLQAKQIPIPFTTTKTIIGICPSGVLDRFCKKAGSNFIETLTALTKKHPNCYYCILPHSDKGHDTDVTLAKELYDNIKAAGIDASLISETHTALELKSVIAACNIFVGARYHSLISALSSGVPSVALSWNHKYKGLLRHYKQQKHALTAKEISLERLDKEVTDLLENEASIREQIKAEQSRVKEHALHAIALTCTYV